MSTLKECQIAENLKVTETMPIIYIDKLLTIKDLDIDIIKSLSVLEPFGEANKIPIFAYKNIRIDSIRAISEGKHLKMTLKDENTIIDAIGFGMGDLALEYTIGDKVDIAGTLEMIRGLKLKKKKAASFGSFGWSGEAVKLLNEELSKSGFEIVNEGLRCMWTPTEEEIEKCIEFGKEFAEKTKED